MVEPLPGLKGVQDHPHPRYRPRLYTLVLGMHNTRILDK